MILNEIISLLGKRLLRTLLSKINESSPSWFSIIVDEASDASHKEQFNLSVRWVDNSYAVHEDPLGLVCLPDTTAATLFAVVKDILIRCILPMEMCRGQALDGAASMQGIQKGLATLILKRENPAALSVHCFAHCLNLCLQEAGRKLVR